MRSSRSLGFPGNGVKRRNAVELTVFLLLLSLPPSKGTLNTLGSKWRRLENQRITWSSIPEEHSRKRGLQNFAYANAVVVVRQYCWSTNPFPAKLGLIPQMPGNRKPNKQRNSSTDYWHVLIEDSTPRSLERLEVYFTSFLVGWFCLLWLLGVGWILAHSFSRAQGWVTEKPTCVLS